MKKTIVSVFIFLIILICGWILSRQSNNIDAPTPTPTDISRYRGTLTGEYLCLPPKDTKGPQTLECALGMKTTTGEYYAVDLNLMSQENPNLNTGDKFTANGLITPIEMLSTDQWQKYPIKGIFSITDSVTKLP